MLLRDNESSRQQRCHTDVMAGQTEGQCEERNRGSTACAISPLGRQQAPSLLPASPDSLFLQDHRCNTSRHVRFCRSHTHTHNYLTFQEMTGHYAPSYMLWFRSSYTVSQAKHVSYYPQEAHSGAFKSLNMNYAFVQLPCLTSVVQWR